MLLAERLRSDEEKAAMRAVLEEQVCCIAYPDRCLDALMSDRSLVH